MPQNLLWRWACSTVSSVVGVWCLQVMEEAKARADNEQLTLSKSWGAAVFVFATWDALLLLLVAWACRCRTLYWC